MTVLLMQLYGPLQSYGSSSKFTVRDTELWPTKSAVVGMLAAAEGRQRDDGISDLAALRFGVRVDRPGRVQSDFHTVQQAKYDTRKGITQDPIVSTRRYIADAGYLVALEGDKAQLQALAEALEKPKYVLSLGRRACIPSRKVALGVYDYATVEDALENEPNTDRSSTLDLLECLVEDLKGNIRLRTRTKTFSEKHREYGSMTLRRYWVEAKKTEDEELEVSGFTADTKVEEAQTADLAEEVQTADLAEEAQTADFNPMTMFGGIQ